MENSNIRQMIHRALFKISLTCGTTELINALSFYVWFVCTPILIQSSVSGTILHQGRVRTIGSNPIGSSGN